MSHTETVNVVITDLIAFEAACKRLGVEFRKNQTTFAAYSPSTCAHAVHIPGLRYELGLVARGQGKPGYTLALDYYSDGLQIQQKFCNPLANGQRREYVGSPLHSDLGYTVGFEKMVDAYSLEVLKRKAYSQGYRALESKLPNGKTTLTVIVG